ncbi:MAG: hypothetical protein WCC14_17150 [Acidobacteriaceae bacterium]
MANSKVVLLLRVRLADGKRVCAIPAIARNGKISLRDTFIEKYAHRSDDMIYACTQVGQSA